MDPTANVDDRLRAVAVIPDGLFRSTAERPTAICSRSAVRRSSREPWPMSAVDPSPAHQRPTGGAACVVLSMSTRWQRCDIASGQTSAIASGMHAPVLPNVASIGSSILPFVLSPIKAELQ